MLLEILRHTPLWVYLLFTGLLGLGLWQSRPRQIRLESALIAPSVLFCLAWYGVGSTFPGALPQLAWCLGMAITFRLARTLPYLRHTTFDPAARRLAIPGSWVPLRLMMVIFFTKYSVAVALALHPEIHTDRVVAVGVSLIYGILSGLFLYGAVFLWRLSRRTKQST